MRFQPEYVADVMMIRLRMRRVALVLGAISFVLVCAILSLLGYGWYTLLFAGG